MKNIKETERKIETETPKQTIKRNRRCAKKIFKSAKNLKKNTNHKTFLSFCKMPEIIQYILETKYNLDCKVYNNQMVEVKIDR